MLKEAEPLMAKGQVVAHQQFMSDASVAHAMYEPSPVKVKFIDKKNEPVLRVAGDNFVLGFDRTTGWLTQYEVGGTNMLGNGGTLRPNFWRALTDNDMGADFQHKLGVWRNPEMKLVSLTTQTVANGTMKAHPTIIACYDMPAVKAKLKLTYTIFEKGKLNVKMQMTTDKDAKVSDMLRFGMVMQMPYDMDQSRFFGRGPIENYSDRKASERIGIYKQTADQQFFPYIRPQETGTKQDIKWWLQTNASGTGIVIHGLSGDLSMSALHYAIADLDDGLEKEQRHSYQVKKSPFTNLCIDKEQAGVGGTDSWGSWPLEPYRLHYGDRSFEFSISPRMK